MHFIYGHGVTRRLLQEWHALPGRKFFSRSELLAGKSWSEAGEDFCLLQIAKELGVIGDGFYVDIGANLPTRRSNTFALYRAGMRGLCVEPNIELAALFEKVRSEDDVVCAAVGDSYSVGELSRFNFHVFSTCSEAVTRERLSEGKSALKASLLRSSFVAMLPLSGLLETYYERRKKSSFFLLKTDTEGFDFEVLQSNDWKKYKPLCILTESTGQEEKIVKYLEEKGYLLAYTFPVNQLFIRKEEFERCGKLKILSP